MTYSKTQGVAVVATIGRKPKITPDLARLLDMLSYKRPDHSQTDWEFISKFICAPNRDLDPQIDDAGNIWVTVGQAPAIMWSCHTDTVHHSGGRQELWFDGDHVRVVAKSAKLGKSNALGADDTAGCWLALEMIRARVPGVYAFHRGEETGGHGSSHAAKHETHRFASVSACIALDRRGYDSVITHQGGERCCSDAFAKSLAAILGGQFAPDDTGLFTDSANYTDAIGECTNLSVGYFDNHGPRESLDLSFVVALRDSMVAADWSALTFERQPGEEDPDWAAYGQWSRQGSYYRDNGGGLWDLDNWSRDDTRDTRPGTRAAMRGEGRYLPIARHGVELESEGWDTLSLEDYFDSYA